MNRLSIFEHIKDGEYHSAILCTFSFDFAYFEHRIMSQFRARGIRNVHVFADGRMLDVLMERESGELPESYSIFPVRTEGFFHPKIWFLAGKDHGLVLIGSGNLTASGQGHNDEIWAAFSFRRGNPVHSGLFSTIWHYLQSLCDSMPGLLREKTGSWFLRFASWIKELPSDYGLPQWFPDEDKQIALLFNEKENIIDSLIRMIPRDVAEITIISPFYDQQGKLVLMLAESFPDATFRLFFDREGSFPLALSGHARITFFDWSEVSMAVGEKAADPRRLHAKIIHFRTKKGVEYGLLGSANVTPEGFGLSGYRWNQECSLLIQDSTGNLWNSLAIEPGPEVERQKLPVTRPESIGEKLAEHTPYSILLNLAELKSGPELWLWAQEGPQTPFLCQMEDMEGMEITCIPGIFSDNLLVLKHDASFLNSIHTVRLWDEQKSTILSNRIYVTSSRRLQLTNPNPLNKKLDEIQRLVVEEQDYFRLLDAIAYLEEENRETGSSYRSANVIPKTTETPSSEEEELLPLSSFTEKKSHSDRLQEERDKEEAISLFILPVLRRIRLALGENTDGGILEEDEESVPEDFIRAQYEPGKRRYNRAVLKKETNRLLQFFRLFDIELQALLHLPKDPEWTLSVRIYHKFQMAMELLHFFGGRRQPYHEKSGEKVIEHIWEIIPHSGENPDSLTHVKSIALQLIGRFCQLLQSDRSDAENAARKAEILNESLLLALLNCMNTRWPEQEQNIKSCLALNILHLIGQRKDVAEFKADIEQRIARPGFWPLKGNRHYAFDENLRDLEMSILPLYEATAAAVKNDNFTQKAEKGDVVYKLPFGYCLVKKVLSEGTYLLTKPEHFQTLKGFEIPFQGVRFIRVV